MTATVFSIMNHKGGVGKTTTAVNLAAGYREVLDWLEARLKAGQAGRPSGKVHEGIFQEGGAGKVV